jgi:hypothetical protein
MTFATPAAAQITEAPLRQGGVFGTTRPGEGTRQRLNLLFEASETLQSELPAESRFQIPQGDLQSGGYSTLMTTSADYARTRPRTEFGGALFTSFKYYPRLDRVAPVSHSAGLGLTIRLPQQSSLQVNSMAAYAPAYMYELFPRAPVASAVEAIPANPDYRIDLSDSYTYGTNLTLAVGAARATRLTVTADYRHTDFHREIVTRPNLTTSGAAMRVSRGLSRNSSLSLEYQYRTGEYGFSGVTNEHRLALGADYAYPLSASRRLAFHFNLSPSLLELPDSTALTTGPVSDALLNDTLTPSLATRLYRLQGDATVDYDFGRTWRATATYRRGLEYLAVLTTPVFSDAARVELGGLITRRLDVSASGGYASGTSALSRDTKHLDDTQHLNTDTAQLRVRYALKRSLALYSQYAYYYYDLRGQARFAPELPSAFRQHEVRVGFMFFVRPISSNATKGKTSWPERTRPTKS